MFRRINSTLLTTAATNNSLLRRQVCTALVAAPYQITKPSMTMMMMNVEQPQQYSTCRFSSSSSFEKGGSVEASGDTHPDFQPKPVKTDDNTEERQSIMQDIRDTIRDEPVVVFIKGLPECPVCSFSKKMIDILDALQLEYTSFDVLAHPVVRSYVKEVSDWGTIPQVFVKGEFVGGVDIVAEMAKKGQLQMLLEKHNIPYKPYHF